MKAPVSNVTRLPGHRDPFSEWTFVPIARRLIQASLVIPSICLLCMLLIACGRPTQPPTPVSFEDLCGLSPGHFGVMNENEVRSWIEHKYGNPSVGIHKSEVNGHSVVLFAWMQGKQVGNAYLRNGSLVRVSLIDLERGPTFGQVVAGLGQPQLVRRHKEAYEQVLYVIGMDYPTLGVSVDTEGLAEVEELWREGGWAVALTEDMRVTAVHCYTPGSSMEEVLREAFLMPPESVSFQMGERLPWPGFGAWVSLDP